MRGPECALTGCVRPPSLCEAASGASAASTPEKDRHAERVLPEPAVGQDAAPAAEMEKDSADAEDTDYQALLLPGGKFPGPGHARFALDANYGLLRGWVKQPSPCCAAASLAGAMNCLRGLARDEAGAVGHREVLQVMAAMLQDQADQLRQSAERCLGAPLLPLLQPLRLALACAELSLDKKECTKKIVVQHVREVVHRMCAGESVEGQQEQAACFPLLKELIDADAAARDRAGQVGGGAEEEEGELEGDEAGEELAEDDGGGDGGGHVQKQSVVLTFDFGQGAGEAKAKKARFVGSCAAERRMWDWKAAIYKWLQKLGQVGEFCARNLA